MNRTPWQRADNGDDYERHDYQDQRPRPRYGFVGTVAVQLDEPDGPTLEDTADR